MPAHDATVKWSATRICSYACGGSSVGGGENVGGDRSKGDVVGGSSSGDAGIGTSDDGNGRSASSVHTQRSSSDSYSTKLYPTASTSPDGLLVAVDFHSFLVSIYMNQQRQPALAFSSHRFHAAADIHVPTKKMAVRCNGSALTSNDPMTGDHLTVQVQEVLQFLHQYQAAEDDAKELKLAQGLGSEGKMKSMMVEFPSLVVCISDLRLTSVRVCVISHCMAGLRTFQFRGQGKTYSMGGDWVQGGIAMFDDLGDPPGGENNRFSGVGGDQENVNKEMMVDIGTMRFLSEEASSEGRYNRVGVRGVTAANQSSAREDKRDRGIDRDSSSSSTFENTPSDSSNHQNRSNNNNSNNNSSSNSTATSSATLTSPSSLSSPALPSQTSTGRGSSSDSRSGSSGDSGVGDDTGGNRRNSPSDGGNGNGISGSGGGVEVMVVEGIHMTINKRVINSDDFIDDEGMEGRIARICMEQLTPQVHISTLDVAPDEVPDIKPLDVPPLLSSLSQVYPYQY